MDSSQSLLCQWQLVLLPASFLEQASVTLHYTQTSFADFSFSIHLLNAAIPEEFFLLLMTPLSLEFGIVALVIIC